jgi:hypothetical protein
MSNLYLLWLGPVFTGPLKLQFGYLRLTGSWVTTDCSRYDGKGQVQSHRGSEDLGSLVIGRKKLLFKCRVPLIITIFTKGVFLDAIFRNVAWFTTFSA